MMGTGCRFRPKSWRQLLGSEFDRRLYPHEGLPVGSRWIVVEERVWHRSLPAVVCFFRDLASGQRYRVSVFSNPRSSGYGPEGVDFSDLAPGIVLTVEIRQNGSGTFRIEHAELSVLSLADSGMESEAETDGDGA